MAGTLVTALVSGCASTSVPPMGYQGKSFRPEPDERRLWSDAENEEEKLAKTGKTYDDPLLEEYLASVAARLVPEEAQRAGAPAARIAIFRDPTLNAFAMPNGKVYIHTGLLSRVENEARLSMILGHELTHVTNRHALMFNRDTQNKQTWFTALAIAASLGVAVAAGTQAGSGNYVSAEVLQTTWNPADKPELVAQALQTYDRAAALDPTYPDPFRKYLALRPEAPDARRIKEYLVELER